MITNFFICLIITLICVAPIFLLTGIIIGLTYLVKTKLISTTSKLLIIIIILVFIVIILVNFAYVEKPNEAYIKMKKFSNDKNTIGLTKEQVTELLEEPESKCCDENKNLFSYDAGNVFRYVAWRQHTLWAHTSYYVFLINFDQTDKVESTIIKEYVPLGG